MIWTVLFVVAMMVLGCVLFSVHDWGRPSGNRGRRTHGRGGHGEFHSRYGIVHGEYLPPICLRDRPTVGVGAEVFEGHPVMSTEEFQDMVGRD